MDELVSTGWLADRLGADGAGPGDPVVLDASSHLPTAGRDAHAEFAAAHIPGARFLDLASLVDPASPVPATLPTPEQFAARLADLGISNGDRVVLYDDSAVRTAARAWFVFRHHGMENVAILDGGLGKWRAEGRPLEGGEARHGRGRVAPSPGPFTVRDKAQMLANLDNRAEQVVDAREAARFTGELPDFRPEVVPGHIPGSINLPFEGVLNPDGTYKAPEAIRAAFIEAGVDLDRPVVTTCGGGVTAAVLLFALRLAGKTDVALYDGSWSEWGADPDTPKATGA